MEQSDMQWNNLTLPPIPSNYTNTNSLSYAIQEMNQFICITIVIYVIINTKTINSIVHIYLIPLNTVSQSKFAICADIQSKCIGIILSYDKYSDVINDLYLGIGQHVLVSEIEDCISGARASYIIQPNITVIAAYSAHGVVGIVNTYNSQKVFAFIIALSHSLSADSFSADYFDYPQINNWDSSITKNSNNLKTITQSFDERLKTKNMITPKVTMQYFDTLYCIVTINLKTETDNTLSDIIAWSSVIDDIYTDFISFNENESINFEISHKGTFESH